MRQNSISEEEYEELEDIITAANDPFDSRLTPWENDFIQDFVERLEKWGNRVTVSPKQWAILNRIKGKVG